MQLPCWEGSTDAWREQAVQQQHELSSRYGAAPLWRGDPHSTHRQALHDKLIKLLYGPPPIKDGYTKQQTDTTERIVSKICKHFTGTTSVSVVFVSMMTASRSESAVPVLRVWSRQRVAYVDTTCRVYGDWTAFLRENRLPGALLCYPREGRYHEALLQLDFGTPPRLSRRHRAVRALDVAANVAALAGLVLLMVAEFVHRVRDLELAWGFFFAAVILYYLGKLTYFVYDYKKHA